MKCYKLDLPRRWAAIQKNHIVLISDCSIVFPQNGSRLMMFTSVTSMAARSMPKFTVGTVLPTPPFWLQMVCLNSEPVALYVVSPFRANHFHRKKNQDKPIPLDFPRDFRLVSIISCGHTMASMPCFAGVDSVSTYACLGYAQVSTTADIYAYLTETASPKSADILGKIFQKKARGFGDSVELGGERTAKNPKAELLLNSGAKPSPKFLLSAKRKNP